MYRPVPKIPYKRRKPRRRQRNDFSRKVKQAVYERDSGLCQMCGTAGTQVHHCKFRSAGGRGVLSNGILLCHLCHTKVHRHHDLAEELRSRMIDRYGDNYYQDKWDGE